MAGLGSTSVTAQTRENLRNQMVTSMFGRRAGMDLNSYEVGEQDTRLPVDVIGTTVPTSMSPNGFSLLACTAASSAIHTLQNPVPCIYKQITQISSSTLGIAVQFGAGAQIVTSAGSSFNQITFAGVGHTASLACMSTNGGGVWVSAGVASPGITFSTY